MRSPVRWEYKVLEVKGGGKEEEEVEAVGSGGPQGELSPVWEAAGQPSSKSKAPVE